MTFKVPNPKNALDAKKATIEALKASTAAAAGKPQEAIIRYVPPGECPDRNRIVFDDSGSMGSSIQDAKKGVVEFLRNCIPNQTSVAVHFMNTSSWNTALRSDLSQLGIDLQECYLSSGGTPFFNTLKAALEATPVLTRLIAFTDGAPTDELQPENQTELEEYAGRERWKVSADIIIRSSKSINSGIPIDTVYFGVDADYTRENIALLKYLSAQTGGYFLHFDPAKVNFATAFKYLAPCHRLQLSSGSFRAAIESGAQK